MQTRMKFGLILTMTAVLVVFFALTVLFLCYSGIGRVLSLDVDRLRKKRGGAAGLDPEAAVAVAMALEMESAREDEVAAAVAMALEREGYGDVHDAESFVITIRRH